MELRQCKWCALLLLIHCYQVITCARGVHSASAQITEDVFDYLEGPDNPTIKRTIRRFTLSNSLGTSVQVIQYGATITSLKVAGSNGSVDDIVLGFDSIEGYRNASNPYFGATIGRVANRIAGAKFKLNNITYNLTANDGPNQLHGGLSGFDKQLWEPYVEGTKLIFSYLSRDGEEGYPGHVLATVSYELTPQNELHVCYQGTSTKPTPIGLTNHGYFNLAGHTHGNNELRGHSVMLNADYYTPVDDMLIPTGEIRAVDGTIFDLRISKNLHDQLQQFPPGRGSGYDHNFCINGPFSQDVRLAARVQEATSGRVLEVYTDQPGVQFYTGNFLPENEPLIGKQGARYYKHGAFCLETQNFPNAINQPNFPTPVINPGEIYRHRVVYKFFTIANAPNACDLHHLISPGMATLCFVLIVGNLVLTF